MSFMIGTIDNNTPYKVYYAIPQAANLAKPTDTNVLVSPTAPDFTKEKKTADLFKEASLNGYKAEDQSGMRLLKLLSSTEQLRMVSQSIVSAVDSSASRLAAAKSYSEEQQSSASASQEKSSETNLLSLLNPKKSEPIRSGLLTSLKEEPQPTPEA